MSSHQNCRISMDDVSPADFLLFIANNSSSSSTLDEKLSFSDTADCCADLISLIMHEMNGSNFSETRKNFFFKTSFLLYFCKRYGICLFFSKWSLEKWKCPPPPTKVCGHDELDFFLLMFLNVGKSSDASLF